MNAPDEVVQDRERVERIKRKLLARFEAILDDPSLGSSTDIATITRFLTQQGWRLDPTNIDEDLKKVLQDTPELSDEDEADVIAMFKRKTG